MNLEERVIILEEQVRGLVKSRAMDKMYTDADINGTRQNISNITPVTITKTAYIDDTSIVFDNVPDGNLTVYFDKSFTIMREDGIISIEFEPLTEVTNITISIL